ncbi:hypothetical protein ACQKII_03275 [Lysinibacillus sp. NPDC048646]|uniref:hypothetical protein n=1 Tax=Lysinibacillus sp. NPDC048646 TaxID=3390574 RepID=UPI003CFF314A
MSMILCLGLNFEAAISDDFEESLVILDSAREEGLTIQQNIFTTPFVYEIDFHPKYHSIWDMTQYNEQYSPHNFQKAKITFKVLCDFLKQLIPKGDFCELYFCWIGEESDPIEQKVKIDLNQFDEESLYFDEKYYIKFTNE